MNDARAPKLQLGPKWMASAFEAVPNGWYVLERVVDGEEARPVIPVHEHQQPCWDALIAHLAQQPAKTLRASSGAQEFDSFFLDCDVPKPSLQLVQEMVAHFATGRAPRAALVRAAKTLRSHGGRARDPRQGPGEARKLPGVPKVLPHEGRVEWSHRPMRNVFAMAHWEHGAPPGAGFINVNRVLDSPDVSAATVRFLLWHEYVHLFLQQGHTKVFREWERKWPGYIAADRELDTLCERFAVTSW